jgi:uncharacterized membrane protein
MGGSLLSLYRKPLTVDGALFCIFAGYRVRILCIKLLPLLQIFFFSFLSDWASREETKGPWRAAGAVGCRYILMRGGRTALSFSATNNTSMLGIP